MVVSTIWDIISHMDISLLAGIHESCLCSSTREASILLNEANIGEERCRVYFQSTEKRFNILAIIARSYSQRILNLIMHAYIISHNMIIDDERDGGYDDNYHTVTSVVTPPITYEALTSLTTILQNERI
jgi:hypothetical protein